MLSPLISIIIPVYKVEKYLPRCIESVLNQTYKNFELILVDDGSPDNSGKICDEYALKDERIKVIHKENGGVSSARNAGIDVAKGEFINFIDSDDWVPSNSLQTLLAGISNDCDISVGSFENRDVKIRKKPLNVSKIYISDLKIERNLRILERDEFHGPWGKIYKSKIIKENNLKFPSGVKFGEDALFVKEYLKYCNIIKTTDITVYYYNRLNYDAMTKKFSYYNELVKWMEMLIIKHSELLHSYEINQSDIDIALSRYAFFKLYVYAWKCVVNCRKKKAIDAISIALKCFRNWIVVDSDWIEESNYLKLYNSVLENSSSKLYYYIKKIVYKNRFKQLLWEIIKRLKKEKLEMKRDGLRK